MFRITWIGSTLRPKGYLAIRQAPRELLASNSILGYSTTRCLALPAQS